MLVRHIFGYAPSLLATGLMSFVSLFCFTRLLGLSEYGEYSLTISVMTMLIGVGFSWLQSAASRLTPQSAQREENLTLYSVLYCSFFTCSAVLLIGSGILSQFIHGQDCQMAIWFAPSLAILRSLLNINQAFHRNFVRIAHYNIIEIGQSILSFGSAIALIVVWHMQASGAVIGLLVGLVGLTLFDWRMLVHLNPRNFDMRIFKEVATFGLPFIASYGFSYVLSGSDRILIEHFMGAEQVGIYSAGYAFPDRIGQYLFMAVATASFPLVVRRMEQEGVEAARDQTYTNGTAILALAIPACIGMLIVNRQIAAILIGENFREGAVRIMPWITVAMILNGIAAHYFDHALHLAKKTKLFFITLGPAAVFNFVANLYAIPHYGIMGAAYTTLAGYAIYLVMSITVGCSVFPIKFPFKPALQILICAGIMAAVLLEFDFPEDIFGLAAMTIIGGLVYGLAFVAFDILGLRSNLMRRMALKRARKCYKISGMEFSVLTSFDAVTALRTEWEELSTRTNNRMFGSYAWIALWWKNFGSVQSTARLHIAVARSNGRLVGVLPLVIRQSKLLRIVEWAGYDVFDYGDVLAESVEVAEALWHFVVADARYDIALIKDVNEKALSLPVLTKEMQLRDQRKNYFLDLAFESGDAWLAAQSRKLRGDIRRKTEKMQSRGPVSFQALSVNSSVPSDVLDALYNQKLAWFKARSATGIFERPEVRGFLSDLANNAAQNGILYLAWLRCEDAIVACHMGFVADETLYLYHTTYDADFSAFSPGNIMMCETIKWAADQKLRKLDFMRGDEAYKQRFASGARHLSAFVSARSLIGGLSVFIHSLRRSDVTAVGAPSDTASSEPTDS